MASNFKTSRASKGDISWPGPSRVREGDVRLFR